MLNDNKLRWIPAYLTESAVQRTLSSGHVFTITDWRANRLADALAKSVSYASAISEDSSDFLAAANLATKHACALLGTVTYAANHKEFKAWRANGTPYTKLVRDTCEEQRLHKTVTARAPEAKQQAVTELTTASPDWARDWAAKTTSAEQRVPRHAVSLARSAAEKARETAAAAQDNARLLSVVSEAARSLKPYRSLGTAAERIKAVAERLRRRSLGQNTATELA